MLFRSETGDWTSSIFITKKGAKIGSGPAFDKAFGTAYHNNRIYAFEQKDYNGVFLCTYDLNSRNKITELDLSDYPLLMSAQSSAAGGLTIFTSEEGIVYLAAIMQASPKNTIALFELEGNPVLSGYHIFRNGEQITDVPVTNRYFTDKELPAGNYEYQIQSVYLDDSNSDPSGKLNFTITSQEDCSLHYEAKVYPSTSPYNAIISIADYVAAGSDIRADLENGSPFELFTGSEWNNQDYTRSNTILLDDYTFPNIGKPGAWRYYNPLHTVPEMTNQALAGSQALISMPAPKWYRKQKP